MKDFNRNDHREINCPIKGCPQREGVGKNTWKNLQHHLYMNHNMSVEESHKLAHEACAAVVGPEPRGAPDRI